MNLGLLKRRHWEAAALLNDADHRDREDRVRSTALLAASGRTRTRP
jgi:hypothetical protein